jgi:shikimate-5-dehydrogenase
MAIQNGKITTTQTKLQERPIVTRNYYIFGQGISFSMSPTIHLSGFQHFDLPFTYEIHQTQTVDELSHIISSPAFGGSSVTMPHKLAISKFCSSITEHARVIGAVNTLIPENDSAGRIRGDNTDWSGLVEVIREKSNNLSKFPEVGLVIGAGGASRAALYAMYQSGLKTIYLFNRTKSRAEEIVRDFAPLFSITVLDRLDDVSNDRTVAPDVIIGTIPADRTTIDSFPKVLFDKPQGICIDMAYKPRRTPLLEVAMQRLGWITVTGVEVLLEQAFDQFKLWTGEDAPKDVMKAAVAARDREIAGERSLIWSDIPSILEIDL